MRLEDIRIDDEFRELLCPLSAEQYVGLTQSIERDGWLDPLIVWLNHNILLDGHNRYSIWEEIGGEGPEIVEKKFASREEARDWLILNQLNRRNLDPKQAALLRGSLHEQRKKPEGRPKLANGKLGNSCPVSTAEQVARETGVSPRTVKNDAEFARAVNGLDASGVLPKAEALKPAAAGGLTRKSIVEAAKQPTPQAAAKALKAEKPPPRYPSSDLFDQWLETIRMRTDGILHQFGSLTNLMNQPTWDHNYDGLIHPKLAGLVDTVSRFEEEMAEWRKENAKKTSSKS